LWCAARFLAALAAAAATTTLALAGVGVLPVARALWTPGSITSGVGIGVLVRVWLVVFHFYVEFLSFLIKRVSF
jgi:hypothetical protein